MAAVCTCYRTRYTSLHNPHQGWAPCTRNILDTCIHQFSVIARHIWRRYSLPS
jgi:hypothetical protein